MILIAEMRLQQRYDAERQSSIGKRRIEARKSPREPRHVDTPARFVFAHTETVDAIVEHRRASSVQVQAPFFDLRQVRDELCRQLATERERALRAVEHLLVRQMIQLPESVHGATVT